MPGQIAGLNVAGSGVQAKAVLQGWVQLPGEEALAALKTPPPPPEVRLHIGGPYVDGVWAGAAQKIDIKPADFRWSVNPGLNTYCGFHPGAARFFEVEIPIEYVRDVRVLYPYVMENGQHVPFIHGSAYTTQGVLVRRAALPEEGGVYRQHAQHLKDWRNLFNAQRDCALHDSRDPRKKYNALFLGDSNTDLWGQAILERLDPGLSTLQYAGDAQNSVACRSLQTAAYYQGVPGLKVWKDYFEDGPPPANLPHKPAKFSSRNAGLRGDSTEGLLYRLTADTIEFQRNEAARKRGGVLPGVRSPEKASGLLDIAAVKPNMIYLLIGANNLKAGHSREETFDGIRAVVNVIRARAPDTKIFLMGVLAKGVWMWRGGENWQYVNVIHGDYGLHAESGTYTAQLYADGGKGINDLMRSYWSLPGQFTAFPSWRDKSVYFVDPNFGERATQIMVMAPQVGYVPHQMYFNLERSCGSNCAQFVHLNEAGFRQIAMYMAPAIWALGQ